MILNSFLFLQSEQSHNFLGLFPHSYNISLLQAVPLFFGTILQEQVPYQNFSVFRKSSNIVISQLTFVFSEVFKMQVVLIDFYGFVNGQAGFTILMKTLLALMVVKFDIYAFKNGCARK